MMIMTWGYLRVRDSHVVGCPSCMVGLKIVNQRGYLGGQHDSNMVIYLPPEGPQFAGALIEVTVLYMLFWIIVSQEASHQNFLSFFSCSEPYT